MKEIRVIIAGGREFDDYVLLSKKMDYYLQQYDVDEITVISGTAKGADQLGEKYAKERGYNVVRMPADWKKHGKSAGYKRNQEMANVAMHCVCFWDQKSRGTGHMIDIATKGGLKLRVVNY